MGGLAWFFTSAGGYVAVSMLAYRFQYIRTFKRFRRWQLEAPDGRARFDRGTYSYGYGSTTRKELDYWKWFGTPDYNHNSSEFPPPFMLAWPICLGIVAGNKILHPEIKLPDPKKISEIETGGPDDLDAKLAEAERQHCEGGCTC